MDLELKAKPFLYGLKKLLELSGDPFDRDRELFRILESLCLTARQKEVLSFLHHCGPDRASDKYYTQGLYIDMNKYPNYMFIDFDSARGPYSPTHEAVSPGRSPSPEVLEAIEAQIASQKAVSPNVEPSTAPLPGEAGSSATAPGLQPALLRQSSGL
jgi:hypothetical protein